MSVKRYGILNDVSRTVLNITTYDENDVPESVQSKKYVDFESWMAPGVVYGWTDETKTTRCVCGDCEYFDTNGVIQTDETARRLEVKEAHKAAVKARRKELQYGWMLAKCANGDLTVLCNEKNRVVIEDGADKVARYGDEISSIFPDGIIVETGDEDDGFMTIPVDCVEDLEKMISLTTQMLFDRRKVVLVSQILVDFNDTENVTLAQFESKNYVTDSGAYNETVNNAIADDTVFAQPTTEPV